ncbi:STAS/SEC14 domain-containing protein [Salicibibacter kimchii]|uniref:STAS/SEC14 domain-containing protein n=1 Tax=Salicibibacter kimchii TaxID=2099786 RepID=A0A345BXK2_9BACI|nr:STAS/SEC14 domain-containing protein [Salicibibacter kimchii]AXF55683.1 STAS/SEC14 domain-containing protein [Salicibibacter kimchii]
MDRGKVSVKVGDYLPGVTTKNFDMDELEEAWAWLRK